MDRVGLAAGTHVDWREVAEAASDRISPGGERVVDGWRKAGISVSIATVSGDPFWTLQETTLAPALLAATISTLQTCAS
jgi:hypothetical protein